MFLTSWLGSLNLSRRGTRTSRGRARTATFRPRLEVLEDRSLFTVGLSIYNLTAPEGNSGKTSLFFIVSLSEASQQTVTVHFATANGTATAGSGDYDATFGPLTFIPGVTSRSIKVRINGDLKNEATETFFVNLSAATNAVITTSQGQGTILNDDPLPTLSIADVQLVEGSSGTKKCNFVVSLSAASGQTVTVDYATANVDAQAGFDYVAKSGSLTFNPGVTSRPVAVTVTGDTVSEADETFSVTLTGPGNAILLNAAATGTIQNDDNSLSIGSASVTEGDSGFSGTLSFPVTLSAPSANLVTVDYAIARRRTASAGSDYRNTSGTLSFYPGVTGQDLFVSVIGDTLNEADETLQVTLSTPVNAAIAVGKATGTILNDDPLPSLTVATDLVRVVEGSSGTALVRLAVTLTAASGRTVSVSYATANNTAKAGGDYVAGSGKLTFAPGVTTQAIFVSIKGDAVDEPDEALFVKLTNPAHATLTNSQAQVVIVNDDPLPILLLIGDPTGGAVEEDSGSRLLTIYVALSADCPLPVTVNYLTTDDTATAGSDYQAKGGTLTFAPGSPGQPIDILVYGDTFSEPDETFNIYLSSPTNAVLLDTHVIQTIFNDDNSVSISTTPESVTESNTGVGMVFTVTLSAPCPAEVTVHYATADGTAVAGRDYVATSGMLTFAPGMVSQTMTVLVLGDKLNEANEDFFVNLSNPTNALLGLNQWGTGTILDDDPYPSISVSDAIFAEGNVGTRTITFTVSLSAASGRSVTVNYMTANNTATAAGNDYVATNGTLTFNPGETSRPITVSINGDLSVESDETFFVKLLDPTSAVLANDTAIGTILNDDV